MNADPLARVPRHRFKLSRNGFAVAGSKQNLRLSAFIGGLFLLASLR
jgi:hypothetical protein